jgi:hypothetical protein
LGLPRQLLPNLGLLRSRSISIILVFIMSMFSKLLDGFALELMQRNKAYSNASSSIHFSQLMPSKDSIRTFAVRLGVSVDNCFL